ncbi:glycosyltransferase family 4 protein [bacterium]|jgi:glycosyltransferase involved in cell wall biosynthesis|nr:glycosyltransferase family 4 protein [bacterium]
MNILFVNRLLGTYWGGGESFTYNAAKIISKMGHKVCILSAMPLLGKKNGISGVDVTYIRMPYLKKFGYMLQDKFPKVPSLLMQADSFLFSRMAYSWIKSNAGCFDVIQLTAQTYLAEMILSRLGKPVVLRFPGPPSEKWHLPALKRLDSNPRALVFGTGDAVIKSEKMGIHMENISQGVDSDIFKQDYVERSKIRAKYGIKDSDFLFFSCARLIKGKGLGFLIKGFCKANLKIPGLKLIISGEGILEKKLLRLIKKLNLDGKVFLSGFLPYNEVYKYYSAADAYVLLSHYENFSNTVLEAMACGLPVITTDAGGFPLQVQKGKNGFMIPYNDMDTFVSSVNRVYSDVNLRKTMRETNRNCVKSDYRWETAAEKMLGLYRKVINA